jgi:uncharacterized integral membrane protein
MKKAKTIFTLILVAIGAIIVLQNTEATQTNILWYTITMPRAVLLVATALIGFAIGVIVCLSAKKKD